jgi:hypothetical protein
MRSSTAITERERRAQGRPSARSNRAAQMQRQGRLVELTREMSRRLRGTSSPRAV